MSRITYNNKVASDLTLGEAFAMNTKIVIGAATVATGVILGGVKGLAVLSMEYASLADDASTGQKMTANLITKPVSQLFTESQEWGFQKATTFHLPTVEEIMAKEEAATSQEQ